MNTTSRVTVGLLFAAASAIASAQTTPAPAASQPTAVGVTAETAKAANDKAIQRSDVATVVRTGPTAADKARDLKADVKTKTASPDGMTQSGKNMTANENRPPRADRN